MAINKETITSVFDEKLTLMQWLKTINKALEDAVLTGVEVRQKGNATFSFVVNFEDGTELESNEFVLAQGESINGATIRNGHLYLSLTNGDELDAGNLKPVTSFAINANQHLIVNYDDSTSQDLGPIFQGNVSIDGNLTANKLRQNIPNASATILSIYPFSNLTHENIYNRYEEINGVLHLIINVKITNQTDDAITINTNQYLLSMEMYFGNTIGDNLIDLNGNSVSSAITTRTLITSFCGFFSKNINNRNNNPSNLDFHFFNETDATHAIIYCVNNDALTINAGESGYITARAALTLI